jgi:hypothetical protein
MRIKQGRPPCTGGVLAFLGLTGLNLAIEEPTNVGHYGW